MHHHLKNSGADGLIFNWHRLTGLTLLILTLIAASTAALPSLAQFVPPNRGLPGRREGGGTRGGCPQQQPGLTALMPESNLGKTLAPYPTLFWYVPQNQAGAAEFVLLGRDNVEIYQTQVPVPTQAGIVSLTLPQDQQIEFDQPYRWYFSLVCDPLDRSADSFTSGWIERVELTAELSDALTVSSAADLPNLYARAGLWQDALTELARLHQAAPNDPALLAQWQALLKSVGLEALADQPIPAVD
jgi:hypothetical protein